jgi:feruloyl esterase
MRRCDALDGAADGIVQDTKACQSAFSFERDVPTCGGDRDGTCLTAAQKAAIALIFSGAVRGDGRPFYTSFPFDGGHNSRDSAFWEFLVPLRIDSAATAMIWGVPPANPSTFVGASYALTTPIDSMLTAVAATDATYTESALSFMQPVNPTDLSALRNRGAKVIAYHGVSDAIFSVNDTSHWYEGLQATSGDDASRFARFFPVPGMAHCGGGPSTDQSSLPIPEGRAIEGGRDKPRDGREFHLSVTASILRASFCGLRASVVLRDTCQRRMSYTQSTPRSRR